MEELALKNCEVLVNTVDVVLENVDVDEKFLGIFKPRVDGTSKSSDLSYSS
jgi:hypothetical protein